MVGPSKILTVSYGTFSCTLEGFDDPFSTMKAIAEYFRDLAADDRYFGAEPPQPDAAMLHRIAEREVHRRVEARVQDNGVILRAADAPAGTAPVPPSYVPAYVPAGAASPLSDSVAAKLQRLRHAAVASPALATAPDEAEIVPEPPARVIVAAPEVTVLAPAAVLVDEAAVEVQVVVVSLPEPIPEAVAEVVAELVDAMDATPEVEASDVDTVEVVVFEEIVFEEEIIAATVPDVWQTDEADDLPVIADEVDAARELTEAIEDWALPEAEASAGLDAAAIDDDADLMESLAAALAGPADEIAPVVEAAPEPDAAEDAMLATLIEDIDETTPADAAPDTAKFDAAADDAAFEAALLAATATDAPAVIGDEVAKTVVAVDDELAVEAAFNGAAIADVEATDQDAPAGHIAADQAEAAAEAATVADESALVESAGTEAPVAEDNANTAETAESTVSAAKLQRARARVIKIRRAEPPLPAEILTPEAEEDFARELDALKSEAPVRPQLPEVTAETSVQRLIDQTNTQFDGAENRRRHAAIEHLKAAVAATAADRLATGGAKDPAEATRLNAYRSDLERVVRPRRPTPTTMQPDAPATPTARPAPLVLVSAQRIDRPANPMQPSAPVRPRRVAGGSLALSHEAEVESAEDDVEDDENLFSPNRGFAEFAERLGAQELPDLLEAAVAYAACVEGRPHVSRPYMMRQVGTIMPDAEAKRDEMLQGFGRLLRNGRIEKVRAGLYALPGSSRMMAEAKKIAV